MDCLLLRLVRKNGKELREIESGRVRSKKKGCRGRCLNSNCLPQVSRLLPYPDLIATCLLKYVCIIYLTLLIEIPKPYGVFAPFKPSEPGASMRHVVKPKIREIEY